MPNKVSFGLKNVYYATYTDTAGTITFGTPVALAGGVNLNLSAQGQVTKFYADNVEYFRAENNQGYTGDVELARIPDAFFKDILGLTEGATSKVLTENANTQSKEFALLFQIEGDVNDDCYVFYRCTASKPAVASGTIQATKEPVTQSITIEAIPMPDGKVRARTTADTPAVTKSAWFTTVFVES